MVFLVTLASFVLIAFVIQVLTSVPFVPVGVQRDWSQPIGMNT